MNEPIESAESAAQRESHAIALLGSSLLSSAVLTALRWNGHGLTRAELAKMINVLQSTLCSKLHRMQQLDQIESLSAHRLDPDTGRKVTVYYIKGAAPHDTQSQAS